MEDSYSRTFSQDESIDEDVEANNFSIREIARLSIASTSSSSSTATSKYSTSISNLHHPSSQHATFMEFSLRRTGDGSAISCDYQSMTGTGRRPTNHSSSSRHTPNDKRRQPASIPNTPDDCEETSSLYLSSSSEEGTTSDDVGRHNIGEDGSYSIPDFAMKRDGQITPNFDQTKQQLLLEASHSSSIEDLIDDHDDDDHSSAAGNPSRTRTTPVEIQKIFQDLTRSEDCATPMDFFGDDEKSRGLITVDRTTQRTTPTVSYRVASPTQHLTSTDNGWCGDVMNMCVQRVPEETLEENLKAVGDTNVENIEDDAIHEVSSAQDSLVSSDDPATRRIFSLIESATKVKVLNGNGISGTTSNHTSHQSVLQSASESYHNAKSARLMSRMMDRALHFQKSNLTSSQNAKEIHMEDGSVSVDTTITPDEKSSDIGLRRFFDNYFMDVPKEFLGRYMGVTVSPLLPPDQEDEDEDDEGLDTDVTPTRTESTEDASSSDEEGIPQPYVEEPTTSDDSFNSEETEKQVEAAAKGSLVSAILGLTSKLNTPRREAPTKIDKPKRTHIAITKMATNEHEGRSIVTNILGLTSNLRIHEASPFTCTSSTNENACASKTSGAKPTQEEEIPATPVEDEQTPADDVKVINSRAPPVPRVSTSLSTLANFAFASSRFQDLQVPTNACHSVMCRELPISPTKRPWSTSGNEWGRVPRTTQVHLKKDKEAIVVKEDLEDILSEASEVISFCDDDDASHGGILLGSGTFDDIVVFEDSSNEELVMHPPASTTANPPASITTANPAPKALLSESTATYPAPVVLECDSEPEPNVSFTVHGERILKIDEEEEDGDGDVTIDDDDEDSLIDYEDLERQLAEADRAARRRRGVHHYHSFSTVAHPI